MPSENPAQAVAVTAEASALREHAGALAARLGLPMIDDPADRRFPFLLVLTPKRLELRETTPGSPGPVYVDFASGALAHRRRFGGGRNQALAKAVGLKGRIRPAVLDPTAGLGRDAFALAALGCTVKMVERSPLVAALLEDGLRRAMTDPEIGSWMNERMSLVDADGRVFMTRLENQQRPDVVYLDPMYPQRGKTALVKKEMRALRRILGEDADAHDLLAAALNCARRRVVVKRPRSAPSLEGPKPDARVCSENTRFDLYIKPLG